MISIVLNPPELVERFPRFARRDPEPREVVILHFETRSAEPGERTIRIGDAPDRFYFISSGEVEVSVKGRRINLGSGSFLVRWRSSAANPVART